MISRRSPRGAVFGCSAARGHQAQRPACLLWNADETLELDENSPLEAAHLACFARPFDFAPKQRQNKQDGGEDEEVSQGEAARAPDAGEGHLGGEICHRLRESQRGGCGALLLRVVGVCLSFSGTARTMQKFWSVIFF